MLLGNALTLLGGTLARLFWLDPVFVKYRKSFRGIVSFKVDDSDFFAARADFKVGS